MNRRDGDLARSMDQLILGIDDDSISHALWVNGRNNVPPTFRSRRRSWLRLDITDDAESVRSFTTQLTHDSESPVIPKFPEPPRIVNMGDVNKLQADNYQSSTDSTRSRGVATNSGNTQRESGSSAITSDAEDTQKERHGGSMRERQEEHERERAKEMLIKNSRGREMEREGITDFFGSEVYQIVLRNPTTAHRLLKFCQHRACGENMEFLEKVSTSTSFISRSNGMSFGELRSR